MQLMTILNLLKSSIQDQFPIDLPEESMQETFLAGPRMPACQTKESTPRFAARDEADVIKLVGQKDSKGKQFYQNCCENLKRISCATKHGHKH